MNEKTSGGVMLQSCLELPVYGLAAGVEPELREMVSEMLPLLAEAGLSVAVIDYAQAGTSDHLIQCHPAGCRRLDDKEGFTNDVVPLRHFGTDAVRYRFAGDEPLLLAQAKSLLRCHDLVLIAGGSGREGCWQFCSKRYELQLEQTGQEHRLVLPLSTAADGVKALWAHAELLQKKRPVWACVLIGGKSSRMGRPKHLIEDTVGTTWLERLVTLITPHMDGIVLSGRGDVPKSLNTLARIPDIPGVEGPLTGILSAMRWQPDMSWVLLACDMPQISDEAIRWLQDRTSLGVWAGLPSLNGGRTAEPLFARYEPQSKTYFEELAATGERRIGRIREFDKTKVLQVPAELQRAWSNINTPQELRTVTS